MRVTIARSAEPGCEPNCAQWIAAQGRITAGTPAEFRRALKQLGARNLPIFIHSGGGLIPAALEIGRMLRARNLAIHVSGTILETCVAGDSACAARQQAGEPHGDAASFGAQCASACSFILAAGRERLVPLFSQVGVHRATAFETRVRLLRQYRVTWKLIGGRKVETSRTLVSETEVSRHTARVEAPESASRDVAKYFAEMGVSQSLLPLIAATPASDIHWLNADELVSTGLATGRGGGSAWVAARHAAEQAKQRLAQSEAAPPPAAKPAAGATLKEIIPLETQSGARLAQPLSAAASAASGPAGQRDAPDARARLRLGPVDGRFLDFDLSFRRSAMADSIAIEASASAGGAPAETLPLVLHFDLTASKSFAAVNVKADEPSAPLGALIPRLDFCELLFEPWLTVRLENRAGGETALQVQPFINGELKSSGLCPYWKRSGALN